MMQKFVQLVIFTTDAAHAATLKVLFAADPQVQVAVGTGPEISSRLQLDALWLTPMQASYYGVSQPLPFGEARIFNMPGEKKALGLPRLLIAGVALAPEKSYSSAFLERVPATALAAAIAHYNANHDLPIARVGSIPENLNLGGRERSEASRAVKQAFANLKIQAQKEHVLNVPQRA